MKNNLITKKNFDVCYKHDLARVPCIMTLEEQKLLYYIFSKINPYKPNPVLFKIGKKDFFDKLGIKGKDRYFRYKNIIQGIIKKSYFELKDEKDTAGIAVIAASWNPNKSYFEVEMNHLFMPYLENLLKYTRSSSEEVFKLDTKNSLTLYKWMSSWTDENRNLNERYESLEYFRELLNDGAKYPNFKDFEKRIFKPSIKKIKEKTGIDVNYEKLKKNGRVWGLGVSWTSLEQTTKLLNNLPKRTQGTITISEAIDKYFDD